MHSDDDDPTAIDAPEYMFAYIEPGFAVTDQFHIGLPGGISYDDP